MRVKYHRGGSNPIRAGAIFVDRSKANLKECGQHLAQEIRNRIAIQGPPRSTPGNPPHMETQRLIASYDFSAIHQGSTFQWTVTVGSTEEHAPHLEQGTWKMAPRPHIVSTLVAQMNPMAIIMGR